MKLWKTWTYIPDRETLDQLRAFYRDVMGFPIVDDNPGESVWFDVGGGDELGFHVGEASDKPSTLSLVFLAEDVDAEVARIRSHGVEIVVEPADMSWGDRAAAFYDPGRHSVWIQRPARPGGTS